MKKLIAVLIALAMVLSMSVMAFAGFNGVKSPAEIVNDPEDYNRAATLDDIQINDIQYLKKARDDMREQGIYNKDAFTFMTWDEAWDAYYDYVLANVSSDPMTAVTEIIGSVTDGYVQPGDAIAKVGETIMGGAGGDGQEGDLSGIVDQIIGSITGGDKEPEVSADAYADELAELINSGAAFEDITKKIGDDLANGKIVANQIPDIAKAVSEKVEAGEIENNETVQKILDFMEGLGGGEGGFEFPDFGDIKLPWDNDNSSSGSFLDTILGIIGSIGDLFNPSTPDDPTPGPGSNEEPGTTDPIPDTGDVSFVAVAAVAAVAGAALVLTRKKNDAE